MLHVGATAPKIVEKADKAVQALVSTHNELGEIIGFERHRHAVRLFFERHPDLKGEFLAALEAGRRRFTALELPEPAETSNVSASPAVGLCPGALERHEHADCPGPSNARRGIHGGHDGRRLPDGLER